jgi:hypothetical protein
MLKKAKNRLLARAAQKRLRVYAGTYRAATARRGEPMTFFSILLGCIEPTGGLQLTPRRRWTLSADLHNFCLATRADGLYTDSGRIIARNPAATSSYVGPEFDIQATWQASQHLQAGLGYAHLFAGGFLPSIDSGTRLDIPLRDIYLRVLSHRWQSRRRVVFKFARASYHLP